MEGAYKEVSYVVSSIQRDVSPLACSLQVLVRTLQRREWDAANYCREERVVPLFAYLRQVPVWSFMSTTW